MAIAQAQDDGRFDLGSNSSISLGSGLGIAMQGLLATEVEVPSVSSVRTNFNGVVVGKLPMQLLSGPL